MSTPSTTSMGAAVSSSFRAAGPASPFSPASTICSSVRSPPDGAAAWAAPAVTVVDTVALP